MIRTCSTGYTGSIHVNALRGGHTRILTSWTKAIQETSRMPAFGQHMPGLKIIIKGLETN